LQDERFLQVTVGHQTTLLNVDNLGDARSGELEKLTQLLPLLVKFVRTIALTSSV
jgi:hypothetical protein